MIIATNILVSQADELDDVLTPVEHLTYNMIDRRMSRRYRTDNVWKRHQKAPRRFGSTDKIQNHLESEYETDTECYLP